jgi:hypothetical protein
LILRISLVFGRHLSANRILLNIEVEPGHPMIRLLNRQCAFQTEAGRRVVLNNGIEVVATYFVMRLTLFFLGGGRYFSADDWIARRWRSHA